MKFSISKVLLLVTVSFICSNITIAQEKGMKFFEGSWDELMATAKKTGKPVFVDVYTTWCMPCKMMAKQIFPLESVGNKYNESFINYKMDAETKEGKIIAERYRVNSYPTYLYVKNDGELAHKGGGFNPDPGIFINEADKALQAIADPYTVNKMADDFKKGKRDTAFLKSYISKLSQLEMDNNEALDTYFTSLSKKEKTQPATLAFLGQHVDNVSSRSFAHLMNNIDGLLSRPGGEFGLSNKLANLLERDIAKAMHIDNMEQVKRGIEYAGKLPNLDPFFKDSFGKQKLQYLDKTNKIPELVTATDEFLKDISAMTVEQVKEENDRRFNAFMEPYINGKADSAKDESFGKMRDYFQTQFINSVADKYHFAALHFRNKVKDKKQLEKALSWSRKALQLVPGNEQYEELTGSLEELN